MRKKFIPLSIVTLVILLGAISIATNFEWVIRFRFHFDLLPFKKSESAAVAMVDKNDGILVVRPVSDHYQLKMMSLIKSTSVEKVNLVMEDKHYDNPSMNRTVPRYSMGWFKPVDILLFGESYRLWFLQMWVEDDALYVNLRYQGGEEIMERLFSIQERDLANSAYELMMDAWNKNAVAM